MQPVYLICGVSGSGKSWVCRQLTDKFHYVPHDMFYNNIEATLSSACKTATKPVITECPFGERVLREELERRGLKVIPYFVIEDPRTVAERYFKRERKQIPKAAYTRATTIRKRAEEWRAPTGTSHEILALLQGVQV